MLSTREPILIEKTFNASIKQVWTAWTKAESIMNWFGSDPDGKVLAATLEVQPGGHFEITFQDSDLTKHTCMGNYVEVREFYKLAFTWMWKSEPGVESNIHILFTSEGDTTQMHFEHANTGNESKHGYYKGWLDTFAKLERMLSV